MSAAANNQIWVTATIPGLVAGSNHTFDLQGPHRLKGIPDPIDLHALTETAQ